MVVRGCLETVLGRGTNRAFGSPPRTCSNSQRALAMVGTGLFRSAMHGGR